MNWREIKLGLCPIGKFVFSHEDACHYKELLQDKLKKLQVNYIDIDDIIPDGLIRDQNHVEPVVEYFKKEQIDAIFLPHCNFGTEGAVGMIAKQLGVPTLLWGPRDEAPLPDGTRLRDTLCGLFASSKVLHKLNVPFDYIENCRIDDAKFEVGLINFLRTASVVKAFKTMRIGQIGGRIDFFWTCKINESELLEKFGIEIIPIDIVRVLKRIEDLAERKKSDYQKELDRLRLEVDFEGYSSDEPLLKLLALRDFYLEWAERENLSAICVETFPSLSDEIGSYEFLADALADDAGVPIICETDIHGAISTVMLQSAAQEYQPSFFADITIRHPENENGVLLWHGGSALSLVAKDCRPKFGTHWILPSPISGIGHWRLKDGNVTIARFDGDGGNYQVIAGEGRTISGPFTQNVYTWMEVDDWSKWERAFIAGPYIHHSAVIYEHCSDILFNSCKYLPDVKPDFSLMNTT